ncbi:MAG: S46 family peptidase, partial [Calditrichaeota bacterium]|nr:S46 family peptidase [Calditrichota bacterium]
MQKRIAGVVLVLALLLSGQAMFADEGMWPPYMIKQLPLDELHQRGLQLSADDLINLKDAIVLLGGGTGSFVSPDGLVITNHHVAYGAIQYQSSAKQNFITNGFLAKTREEELPAPGYTASILVDYRDVTKRVLKNVKPGMSDLERAKAIEKAENEIVKEAESKGKGLSATVVDMLSGTSYYLFV